MADTILKARLQQLCDTEENWNRAITFVPKAGELVVYLPDDNHENPRLKLGDGHTPVKALAFIDASAIDLDNIVAKRVKGKLTFGMGEVFQYDGSEDVTVPVYMGQHI